MDYGLNATTVASGGYAQMGVYKDGGALTATTPIGGVADAIGALDSTSGNILSELDLLEQRLAPVLRPAMPNNAAGAQGVRPTPSPLANGMREVNDRLYRAIERLRELSSRVDL